MASVAKLKQNKIAPGGEAAAPRARNSSYTDPGMAEAYRVPDRKEVFEHFKEELERAPNFKTLKERDLDASSGFNDWLMYHVSVQEWPRPFLHHMAPPFHLKRGTFFEWEFKKNK